LPQPCGRSREARGADWRRAAGIPPHALSLKLARSAIKMHHTATWRVDGTEASVSKRLGHVYADENGTVTPAGPAPYLDCEAAPDTAAVAAVRGAPWRARSWWPPRPWPT
jgi:hypothetical protein